MLAWAQGERTDEPETPYIACRQAPNPLSPLSMEPNDALVALNLIEHVGPVRVRQLLEHFGEAPAILGASRQQLLQVRGIGEDTADAIANWEKTIDLATELKRITEFGCHIVIQTDPEYPELLRQIYDPPVVLYVKGT